MKTLIERGGKIGLVLWWQVRHSCGHLSKLHVRSKGKATFHKVIEEGELEAMLPCDNCARLQKAMNRYSNGRVEEVEE